jgi:phosphate transport system permease protein
MGPAIVGTLLITGTATLMAVPLGILAAVYLNEYGKKNRLSTVIRTMSDVMTGVPSIVMGLFIYTVWVLRYGLSGFAGALALACLMLPIVIRSTEEILRLVPDGLREASLALGASRARTIVTVVLPAAISGITSGALLAVARAAGETAPLLFTVGASRKANWHVFSGANTALSTQIFRNAQQPFPGAQDRAWGAALTLIVLVVVLTIGARLITKRFAVPLR